jgi:hypothetical protein
MPIGQVTQCRSCGARIVFLLTAEKARSIPVNAATVQPGMQTFVPGLGHVAHFATCPQARDWRKSR